MDLRFCSEPWDSEEMDRQQCQIGPSSVRFFGVVAAGVLACVQQGANQLTIQSMTWCIVDLGGFGNTVGICKIAAWVKRYIRL